jgi:hypothetical protein
MDQGSDPATPEASEISVYSKSGNLYRLNSAGVVGRVGMVPVVVSKTFADTPYTVPDWNYQVLVNATGGAVTVVLPAAANNTGRDIDVKKTDSSANAVTVDGNGAETIDGSATKVISTQNVNYTFRSDGTNVIIK